MGGTLLFKRRHSGMSLAGIQKNVKTWIPVRHRTDPPSADFRRDDDPRRKLYLRSRRLGRTNCEISEIGFGGWGIGRAWWGTSDDNESLEALKAAWEAGVNFYDTAYVSGDGHSEELMGRA